MSLAQLQEKVEKQDEEIKKLQEDALNKNNTIKMMEEKLLRLEGQNISNNSLNFVRDRVTHRRTSITTCKSTAVYKKVFGSYCWYEKRMK